MYPLGWKELYYSYTLLLWYCSLNSYSTKAFLKSVENTEYFYSNSDVNSTTTLIEYEYNQENFLTSKEKTTFQEGSQNQILETIYSYPIGQNSNTAPLTSEESNAVSKLIQLNRVNEPLHVKTIKNNVSLKSVATTYKEFSTDITHEVSSEAELRKLQVTIIQLYS